MVTIITYMQANHESDRQFFHDHRYMIVMVRYGYEYTLYSSII